MIHMAPQGDGCVGTRLVSALSARQRQDRGRAPVCMRYPMGPSKARHVRNERMAP
jgi:hypothetical protein